jgi:hypothetical protein
VSRSFKSLVGFVALISAILFTAAAMSQYRFLRHQLRQSSRDELRSLAEGMRDDIAYSDSWDLEGYRRTTSGADIYVVLTAGGTVVDLYGYREGMLSSVSLPFPVEFDHPFTFTSDVGETWKLYMHKLSDGVVILGARAEITPANLNERFAKSAARFGGKVADAVNTPERAIDEAFEFAIIDTSGSIRWAIGGIPLKTTVPSIPNQAYLAPIRRFQKELYSSFVQPITSRSGQKVGVITAFADVTGEQDVLHQSAAFNWFVSAILWIVTVGTAAVLFKRRLPAELSCSQIPLVEEGETVEFKSSLRWDYRENRQNTELEKVIVKTVAGFLNSETGGNLVIGIDDNGQLLGLERDYSTLKTHPNRDGFEQKLQQVLMNAFGERCYVKWIRLRFCSAKEKDLCIVTVYPATEAIYPREKGIEDALLVRIGNTTRPLNSKEAAAYALSRWGGPTLRRPMFA